MELNRVLKVFCYEYIDSLVKQIVDENSSCEKSLPLLFTPNLIFSYHNGWSTNVPKENIPSDSYTIEGNISTVLSLDIFYTKHIFKKGELSLRLTYLPTYVHPSNVENSNEELSNFFKDGPTKKYNNVNDLLKDLRDINHIITSSEQNPLHYNYYYFCKDDAKDNVNLKLFQYESKKFLDKIFELAYRMVLLETAKKYLPSDSYVNSLDLINEMILYNKKIEKLKLKYGID